MAKAMKNPAQAAQNWSSAMQGVTAKVTQGVQAVTQSPGQAAAARQDAYLQGVQSSASKWAQKVAAVPLASWQQAMITKGAPRMASGATAALPKMQSAMAKLLPQIANITASLPPRGPRGQNNHRSAAFADAMHQASKTG